jgi:copper transport protein
MMDFQEIVAMKTLPMIVMTLAATAMQSALAHTELTKTIPEDRAVIEAVPADVELQFSEPVRLTALSVQKDGAPKQSLGPLPTEMTEHFSVALPALDGGHYVVSWRALSEDTHIMSGEFMFAVGAAGRDDGHMNHGLEHAGEQSEQMSEDHHDDHGGTH